MSADSLPEFARIPAGSFVMGADDGGDDERPAHNVYLDGFMIGVQPVSNGEYARFITETGYRTPAVDDLPLVVKAGGPERERAFRASADGYTWRGSQPPREQLDHPVTLVRWEDAAAYCRWLSNVIAEPVRLPTEAEWERAARGGLERQAYPWGNRLDGSHANFLADPTAKSSRGTSACRSFPPNGFGLYDMAGNVWEWVADWYDPAYYTVSPRDNPSGPGLGQFRIVRGGGWLASDLRMLMCSYRHRVPPDTYSYGIGFRVACSPNVKM
jgi:formylglycine-generating enzyme required for sulfatase activity